MLLVGHEHIMKIPEKYMNIMLVFAGISLVFIAIYCSKKMKAHFVAYTMFP